MTLRASNGYTLHVAAATGLPVSLELTKKAKRGVLYASYSAEGRVNAKGIGADFGRLGRVSVAFHPSSSLPEKGCGGGTSLHRTGRFEGTIRFHGEQGFASVSARHASGSFQRDCFRAARPRPAPAARTSRRSAKYFESRLLAVARSSGRSAAVESSGIAEFQPDGRLRDVSTLVLAELEEDRGRIKIERTVIEPSPPLQTSPLGTVPVTASLAPPSPFSGVGTYGEEVASPTSWTGDLTVDLPGAKDVPLAGPGFTAILCRGKTGNEKLNRCRHRATDLLTSLPPQGVEHLPAFVRPFDARGTKSTYLQSLCVGFIPCQQVGPVLSSSCANALASDRSGCRRLLPRA